VRLIERTISWLAWIAAVLWIVGLLPPVLAELDDITLAFGKTRVSLQTIFQGVLSAGLVLVISLWIASTIEKRILREAVTDLSMRKVASNAVRAFLLLVGLLFALSAVGVDLTALSVLGGALGVGLGFGLQKLAANYVSGFVILLERSIRIGDNVKVDTFEGRITDIKTRYTLIRAGNGREAIVPNESLITSRVENLSLADRKFNITTTIVVGYESDVAQVQSILCEAAKAQPRVMSDPEPVAFLMNFAPDGLEFTLNFWVADPDKGKDNLRSAINIAILDGLRGARIDIPYPQRVLRVESLPPGVVQAPDAVL
jgi:small-conductance mechanosensitive channel